MTGTRTERDSLGKIEVPAGHYYGARNHGMTPPPDLTALLEKLAKFRLHGVADHLQRE